MSNQIFLEKKTKQEHVTNSSSSESARRVVKIKTCMQIISCVYTYCLFLYIKCTNARHCGPTRTDKLYCNRNNKALILLFFAVQKGSIFLGGRGGRGAAGGVGSLYRITVEATFPSRYIHMFFLYRICPSRVYISKQLCFVQKSIQVHTFLQLIRRTVFATTLLSLAKSGLYLICNA